MGPAFIDVEKQITQLSTKKRLALAASCCERLIPDYQAFSLVEGWGDFQVLRNALNTIWDYLDAGKITIPKIERMMERCEQNIPESEDFISAYTGLAADAAEAIIYALGLILEDEPENVLTICRISLESIREFLEIVADPQIEAHGADQELDRWIGTSPLLSWEVSKQLSDISLLSASPEINSEMLTSIRSSSMQGGIQPLLRNLVKSR